MKRLVTVGWSMPLLFVALGSPVAASTEVGGMRDFDPLAGLANSAAPSSHSFRRPKGHLSVSGARHSSVRGALAESLTPPPIRQNVRSVLNPTDIAVDVAFPIAVSVTQQAIARGKVDPRRVVQEVQPVSLAGATAGGVAGSAAGAALQSTLAAAMGPAGKVAGFVARPIMAWAGASVGGRYAARAAKGDARIDAAIEETVRSIEPGRDIGAVVGGSVGAAVGQALIPVPVVGGVVGNVAGTMVGAWIGSRLTNPKADLALRSGTKMALRSAIKGAFGRPGGASSMPDPEEPSPDIPTATP